MLEIKYSGKKKEVPCRWDELSIEEFHPLFQVIYRYEDKDIDNDDRHKLNFLRDFVGFLLKEEKDVVDKMEIKDIEHLVSATTNLLNKYEPKNLSSFDFEEETYYFPVDVEKYSFGEYIEVSALDKASELLKNGKFDVVAEQIARLCKRRGEIGEYLEEDVVQERAEKFKQLKMDIVWEFNFFLLKQQGILQEAFRTYGVAIPVVTKQK